MAIESVRMRNACRILVGKSEEKKKPLGRSRSRGKDNIKMELSLIHSGKDREQWQALLNTTVNIRIP
jgi:hypothetical protein